MASASRGQVAGRYCRDSLPAMTQPGPESPGREESMKRSGTWITGILLVTGDLMLADDAGAQHGVRYDVTITNLTRGQMLTPVVVASHVTSLDATFPGGADVVPAQRDWRSLVAQVTIRRVR